VTAGGDGQELRKALGHAQHDGVQHRDVACRGLGDVEHGRRLRLAGRPPACRRSLPLLLRSSGTPRSCSRRALCPSRPRTSAHEPGPLDFHEVNDGCAGFALAAGTSPGLHGVGRTEGMSGPSGCQRGNDFTASSHLRGRLPPSAPALRSDMSRGPGATLLEPAAGQGLVPSGSSNRPDWAKPSISKRAASVSTVSRIRCASGQLA
jgi:hypothetical protein